MGSTLWIFIGLMALAMVAAWRRRGGLDQVTAQTLASGDIGPLVAHIDQLPRGAQENAYNRAVVRIWDGYERPLAIAVIRAMAERLGETWIAQYWIRQALEVEPEAARDLLDERFLIEHYRPEVARQCGSFG
jgi:hypothetical protein